MFPTLCCGDRKRVRVGLAVLVFSVFASLASAQTDNWVGPSGNWSDASQWDNGVPVAGDNIVIGTPTANSIDDFSLAIGALDLGNSGDVLHIADGVALTLTNNEVNSGTIQLNSAGTNTYLLISGSQSFGSSGKVILGTTGPNYMQGASGAGTEVLTSSNTIQGTGSIGNGLMGFVNAGNGTVIANTSAGSLFINVSSAGFNNTGTLKAVTGGNLVIQGPANSFANYNATTSTLTGGTYTANGGNIYFAGSASGITTLSAHVTQEASGQIINTTNGTNAFSNLASITSTGVLTTTAGFTQPGPFSMAGTLNILPGAVVNVGSITQVVEGILTGGQWLLDSNLNITGPAPNIDTNFATVTLSGGRFKNADGSDAFATVNQNGGTLRIMNSTTFTPDANLSNGGLIVVGKGCKLLIRAGYDYEQAFGETINDGLIANEVFIHSGMYLGAGSVAGDLGIGGTYSVGDVGKSALVQVSGTYSQDGILSTGIGGTTVGTQYSQVKAGHATLAGKLVAPLLSGFTPTVGQKFTVVSASPVTGTFSNTTIPINSSEHFAISYTTTKVVLTVVSGPAVE
jgi:hypothetical protein